LGEPREHWLAPEMVQKWAAEARLTKVGYRRQTLEHYALLMLRDAANGE
jgi:hypothetical protein